MKQWTDAKHRFRRRSPLRIESYKSFGTTEAVVFRGRVLANPISSNATLDEPVLRRFGRMAARFLSREVGGVEVHIQLGADTAVALTDAEGYFAATIAPQSDDGWIEATARRDDEPAAAAWSMSAVIVAPTLKRIVVSDIDDTILSNGRGNPFRTVWATIGGSALTRQPTDGSVALYRALERQRRCQFFYVSSSPWNLYGFLDRFLQTHGFPVGPMLLRDIGLNRATIARDAHGTHKVSGINTILDACPAATRAVLIGDSSQHDAAAFAHVMTHRPDKIEAAFIRNVGDASKAATIEALADSLPPSGPQLHLFDDYTEVGDRVLPDGWDQDPASR